MSRKPAISVIIVFHNAESTIERTLRSLAEQTWHDAEYVFVDDGSSDRTVDVIQAFVALHPEFDGKHRLISSPMRRGSAHATGLGYANATGEYVIRCDADDTMDSRMLEIMYDATAGGQMDAVMSPYVMESDSKRVTVAYNRKPSGLNDMRMDTLHFSLCNKLLRRSILMDNELMPFDGVDCWEDVGVVARFMALKPAVAFVDEPLYHYIVNRKVKSLSRSNADRLLHDHLLTALLLEQWFEEQSLHDEYDEFLTHLKFFAKVKMLRGRDKDVARWKGTFPEVNPRIMHLRHLKWYWRILFGAVAALPTGLTQWIADRCDVLYPRIKADAVQQRPNDSHPNIPEQNQ